MATFAFAFLSVAFTFLSFALAAFALAFWSAAKSFRKDSSFARAFSLASAFPIATFAAFPPVLLPVRGDAIAVLIVERFPFFSVLVSVQLGVFLAILCLWIVLVVAAFTATFVAIHRAVLSTMRL